ncbi:MAG: response regulator [Phormidesmis sp.]
MKYGLSALGTGKPIVNDPHMPDAGLTIMKSSSQPAKLSENLSENLPENRFKAQRESSKILVVDDLLENLRLLANLLTAEGYGVRKAPDGAMALSNVPRFQPDLILLDIMMPDMDGYEVCQQLKANEQFKDIPIIFLSALDLTFDKIKAFEVGAVDFIHKPFHPSEVIARVKNQLRIRQQGLQLQTLQATITKQQQQLKAAIQARQIAEARYERLAAGSIT